MQVIEQLWVAGVAWGCPASSGLSWDLVSATCDLLLSPSCWKNQSLTVASETGQKHGWWHAPVPIHIYGLVESQVAWLFVFGPCMAAGIGLL